jgi:enoyl-CoA hydratase/carnithine racemase/nitroimidazol reductase NimA-like FMN-containing flavoprotein (pyridoxamine 5'-phosphate oxidase superfamily)
VSIRLSREEAWAELANAHTGIFTSLRADGTPITLPVWFVVLDERVFFSAPARTKKIARVRRNPRCCFLVESGTYWRELKAVLLTGDAHEITDEAVQRRVRAALDAKYDSYRSNRSTMPEQTRTVYEAPGAATDLVTRTDADGIRTITIDRPEARNAMTWAMRERIAQLFVDASGDDTVDVVVVTGTQGSFSAGVDLKELRAQTSPPKRMNPTIAVRECVKPTIAAVNGVCVTGGLELALACDLIVASEQARFADTHAKAGLMPGWGMSAALPGAVGRRNAVELALTGAFIDAAEALRIGLVNRVVPHDELLARTYELAQSIRAHDQDVVRRQVALYRRSDGLSFAEALAVERDAADEWLETRGGRATAHEDVPRSTDTP